VSISTVALYAVPTDGVVVVTGDDEEAELFEEVQAPVKSPTRRSTEIAIGRP
jgi:hypothetical protein